MTYNFHMPRGYPRPRTKVNDLKSFWRLDESGKRFKSLNKKWGNKEYPHPYTAEDNSISVVHSGRQRECLVMHKCSVCGESIKGDIAYLIVANGKIFEDSGPFHEKCRTLAMTMCPHLAEYKKFQPYDCSWDEFNNSPTAQAARKVLTRRQ